MEKNLISLSVLRGGLIPACPCRRLSSCDPAHRNLTLEAPPTPFQKPWLIRELRGVEEAGRGGGGGVLQLFETVLKAARFVLSSACLDDPPRGPRVVVLLPEASKLKGQ